MSTTLLQQVSIVFAIVLSGLALTGRPFMIVVAMVLSSFVNYPAFVFAQGYNSSILVADIVLLVGIARYVVGTRNGPFSGRALMTTWLVFLIIFVIFSRF